MKGTISRHRDGSEVKGVGSKAASLWRPTEAHLCVTQWLRVSWPQWDGRWRAAGAMFVGKVLQTEQNKSLRAVLASGSRYPAAQLHSRLQIP